jgi:hypothetical protein
MLEVEDEVLAEVHQRLLFETVGMTTMMRTITSILQMVLHHL